MECSLSSQWLKCIFSSALKYAVNASFKREVWSHAMREAISISINCWPVSSAGRQNFL